MSTPALATCQWFHRTAPDYRWVPTPADGGGSASATCRASVGARLITVWLPQGVKIRGRIPRSADPFVHVFRHRYGRDGDDLIEVRLARVGDDEKPGAELRPG